MQNNHREMIRHFKKRVKLLLIQTTKKIIPAFLLELNGFDVGLMGPTDLPKSN